MHVGTGSVVQRNADQSDMYVPFYDNGLYTRIDVPYKQPTFIPVPEALTQNVGDPLSITVRASNAGTLSLSLNSSTVCIHGLTPATDIFIYKVG